MPLSNFKHINPEYLKFRAAYAGFERESVHFDPKELVYKVYSGNDLIVIFNMEGDRYEFLPSVQYE